MSGAVEIFENVHSLIVKSASGSPRVGIAVDGTLSGVGSADCVRGVLTLHCEDSEDVSGSVCMSNNSLFFGRGVSVSGVSMTNNKVTWNGRGVSVELRNDTLKITVPESKRICVNGIEFNVADLLTNCNNVSNIGAVATPAPPKPVYKINVASAALQKITLSGSAKLRDWSAEHISMFTDQLEVRQSGSTTFGLPQRHFGLVKVHVSGASNFFGNKATCNDFECHASGASNVDSVVVNRRGAIDASGASNVTVKAYAREAIERNSSGVARICIKLIRS